MYISSIYIAIYLLIIVTIASTSDIILPVHDSHNITIAFGSCNKFFGQEKSDILYTIADLNPDIWIWLGDAAYIDNHKYNYYATTNPTKWFEIVNQRFNNTKLDNPYQYLLNKTTVIGTWDDHDYGKNNGDKHFRHKRHMQQLWLDFMDEPQGSKRRTREGVYESYYLGDKDQVKIILLDVRYHRETRTLFGLWWDNHKDMLGDEQWIWLEEELKYNHAKYVLIGSGSQFLPDDRFLPEYWFGGSRQRLLDLVKKYKVNGTVILSGDVHWGEIMTYPCWKERFGYPLHEITSSGLTHNLEGNFPILNKLAPKIWPKTYHGERGLYIGKNFGMIQIIEQNNGASSISLEIRNESGHIVMQTKHKYEELMIKEYPEKEWRECPLNVHPGIRFISNISQRLARFEWQVWICFGCGMFITFVLMVVTHLMYHLVYFLWMKIIDKIKKIGKMD